ncbi:MAG: hypothetical protein BGN88_06595 [Clostridiales bacterium 43-6]|nr:MAG: hypothetical protein BGN88_06595 [Clostridiales bacterium 43-6]
MEHTQICCFTGEAELPLDNVAEIGEKLEAIILELIEKGVTLFKIMDESGFGAMAAEIVTTLKSEHRQIQLEKIPVFQVTSNNSDDYEKLIFAPCHALIDNSDYCVVYIKRHKGFPFYNVMYAISSNAKIIYLNLH